MTKLQRQEAKLMDEILALLLFGNRERDWLAESLEISTDKLLMLCNQINDVLPYTITASLNKVPANRIGLHPGRVDLIKVYLDAGGFVGMNEMKEIEERKHLEQEEFQKVFNETELANFKESTKTAINDRERSNWKLWIATIVAVLILLTLICRK